MSWVASKAACSDGRCVDRSGQSKVAVGLDTSNAFRILVGWVAGVARLLIERARGDKAYCRNKCECLTHDV